MSLLPDTFHNFASVGDGNLNQTTNQITEQIIDFQVLNKKQSRTATPILHKCAVPYNRTLHFQRPVFIRPDQTKKGWPKPSLFSFQKPFRVTDQVRWRMPRKCTS
jgi:hypothetical protein